LSEKVWRIEAHHDAKFCWNWSIYSANIAIFRYLKMAADTILNFRNHIILLAAGLRRITVPNFVKIGQSIVKIMQFVNFSRWRPLPSWIFKVAKFYWLEVPVASLSKIASKSQFLLGIYCDFSNFQDGGRPPSWICLGHIWTNHVEYLGVFITLQNLVMIDGVLLIIWTLQYLARLAGKRLFLPPNFGTIWTPEWAAVSTKGQEAHPCLNPRHLSHQAWKSGEQSDLLVSSLKRYK